MTRVMSNNTIVLEIDSMWDNHVWNHAIVGFGKTIQCCTSIQWSSYLCQCFGLQPSCQHWKHQEGGKIS